MKNIKKILLVLGIVVVSAASYAATGSKNIVNSKKPVVQGEQKKNTVTPPVNSTQADRKKKKVKKPLPNQQNQQKKPEVKNSSGTGIENKARERSTSSK